MSDRLKKIKKNKALEEIKRTLGYSLSDADIRHILGQGTKIIEFKDMDMFKTIYDLLPNEKDFAIVLVEQKDNSGHWVMLLRDGNRIEQFDSYGVTLETELNFVSQAMNRMLGQSKQEFHALMKTIDDEDELVFNKARLQSEDPTIATCGRHCCLRALMHNLGYSLEEYLQFLDDHHEETGLPIDVIVSKFVPLTR
jgi:hypothetical protein